jgi:addiction module HigA family antidote
MSEKPLACGLPAMHPGELLREDVIPALGIPVTEVAKHLKVSRQTLHAILREEAPVTPAMALRLGKLCGNGPDLWVNLQARHDLERLSQEMDAELSEIPTLHAA